MDEGKACTSLRNNEVYCPRNRIGEKAIVSTFNVWNAKANFLLNKEFNLQTNN